jgi:hypothetical protein
LTKVRDYLQHICLGFYLKYTSKKYKFLPSL